MRGILVEWMSKIHARLHCAPDTLFLAVNMLDRFLTITPISSDCFQLLGVTAILVAGKMVSHVVPSPHITQTNSLWKNDHTLHLLSLTIIMIFFFIRRRLFHHR